MRLGRPVQYPTYGFRHLRANTISGQQYDPVFHMYQAADDRVSVFFSLSFFNQDIMARNRFPTFSIL